MSRNFTGSRGSNGQKKSAREIFMSKLKNKGKREPTPEERYQEAFNSKMADIRKKAGEGSKFGFNLPGTDPNAKKELSKGALEVLGKIAAKKAKQEEKRLAKKQLTTNIQPKYFSGMQGGRIDSRGNIYGTDGRIVAYIDAKSGNVKKANGANLCKYKGDGFTDYKITRYISQINDKQNSGNSIWGMGENSTGNSFYGSNNDDPTGGFWG